MKKPKTFYGLFNDSFPPVLDGVTLTVQNYVRWLTAKGRDVCVVTPWNPFDPEHPDFEMHRYFSLPIYNRRPYRYGYPRIDPFIWINCMRVPFKIVHAHCPFSSGRLARFASHYHKVPFVATFHSKYKTDLVRSLPRFMVDYQMKRIRDFYNGADELWIPQAAVEETVREYGITTPVTVVENGNDLGNEDVNLSLEEIKHRARQRLSIPPGQLTLLFVGQHILEKGVMVIIDALKLLQHDNVDFGMHFVGTGYAAEEMRQRVTQLGLSDRVKFHGVIKDREMLRDIYASAHLFLFPSFYDNAPLVVREAAMMGTPSVLLRGSTAAEVMTHGYNGFLTERTSEAYADEIRRLDGDREVLRRVAIGARNTLSRSWSDIMTEVSQRYDEIINRYRYAHANR